MSSTNRGAKRAAYDFYATPLDVVEKLLAVEDISSAKTILEPSAGKGNICQVIRENGGGNIKLDAVEIRSEEEEVLKQYCDDVIMGDFLTIDIDKKYDLIIGNPPFSHAMQFIQKSMDLLEEDGKLIFLLRTAFLESKSRYQFWQDNPLSNLFVLAKRPSFDGISTDSTSYSWFIWDKKTMKQKIKVI